MLGIAADANHQIQPGLGGGASAGGVQRRALLAHFQHLAGHQDAALGRPRG